MRISNHISCSSNYFKVQGWTIGETIHVWTVMYPYLSGFDYLSRMFLSPDLLSEYRIQHGAIGPFYVTSSYSTWIFCRGVSGFATDCPCDVWCRGLTTCLLQVGPPFGNRCLNTSWAVGLTYWIVYLNFFILTYAIIYVLIQHIIFWFNLYCLIFFSSTPVLTSSIDVVFVFSIRMSIYSLRCHLYLMQIETITHAIRITRDIMVTCYVTNVISCLVITWSQMSLEGH